MTGKLGSEWVGASVSHATLREQDLIPAFEGVLDLAGVAYERPASVGKLLDGQELTDEEASDVDFYLNEDLFDLLNEVAPEGTYFGAHEGDGSLFGFWAFDDEEVVEVESLDDEGEEP